MTEIAAIRTAAEAGLVDAFAGLRGRRAGDALAGRREAAFQRFMAHGLPHRRVEAWRYTDLRTLMHDAKPLAGAPDTAAVARAKSAGAKSAGAKTAGAMFAAVGARRLTFVDGGFVPELSDLAGLEAGLTITSLAAALGGGASEVTARLGTAGPAEGDVAYALNTAFMGDGAVVRVAAGTQIARPIHLMFLYGSQRPAAVFARSLVVVEAGAGLTLLESHEGPDSVDYQVNTALDLVVGERASFERIGFLAEGRAALHLATLSATVAAKAQMSDFAFLTGGRVVRRQLFVRCDGPGATVGLNGASLLAGTQHGDTSLSVDHAVGGCRSRELFKAVLDGSARGVFQGKIIVRPGAQKTDARMMTRALLLSTDAEADNKPELEIFADDVQCGHGATSGALDDNLKFYLMARGIPERDAEALLIQSFVGEAIDAVGHEGARDALMEATLQWLARRT